MSDGTSAKYAPPELSTPPEALRYRYFTVRPATVAVEAGQLIDRIPAGSWRGTEADKRRRIELPCEEIFRSNVPRIRLSRLSELMPGCFGAAGNDLEVVLPPHAVALGYRAIVQREALPDAPAGEAGQEAAEQKAGEPIPEKASIPAWKKVARPVPVSAGPAGPPNGEAAVSGNQPAVAEPARRESAVFASGVLLREQAGLQRLLMTEEELTLGRVAELAAAFPGLAACAFVRNGQVVASRGLPAGLDAGAVGAWTGAAVAAMKAGAPEGLRAEPAGTFYTVGGPVSFLGGGPVDLIVFHRERGFFPGVREKLGEILTAAAKSFEGEER